MILHVPLLISVILITKYSDTDYLCCLWTINRILSNFIVEFGGVFIPVYTVKCFFCFTHSVDILPLTKMLFFSHVVRPDTHGCLTQDKSLFACTSESQRITPSHPHSQLQQENNSRPRPNTEYLFSVVSRLNIWTNLFG